MARGALTPDIAGIWMALGQPDLARTARVARAMNSGRPYAAIAWPARRPGRRRRPRTGRDWRDQPRTEGGKWAPFQEAA